MGREEENVKINNFWMYVTVHKLCVWFCCFSQELQFISHNLLK